MRKFSGAWLFSPLLGVALFLTGQLRQNTGAIDDARRNDPVLQVNISKLHNNKGRVLLSLFNDHAGFPDQPSKALRTAELAITNNTAAIRFSDLPPGTYAIAILHDENSDGKMNTNFFGIPREGYGFSNNVMGWMGPPSFSKASFTLSANTVTTVTIHTRY